MFHSSVKFPGQYNVENYSLCAFNPTEPQRIAIGAIFRAALEYEGGLDGAWLSLYKVVRINVAKLEYGALSVAFEIHRTDCDQYSPRNVLSRKHYHFFIGKRGAVSFTSCNTKTHKVKSVTVASAGEWYKTQSAR